MKKYSSIPEKDRKEARHWLNKVKYLIESLTDESYFDLDFLSTLITIEVEDRGRVKLIKRIYGRFNRLRKKKEWSKIQEALCLKNKLKSTLLEK